jgi:hypothetical protein
MGDHQKFFHSVLSPAVSAVPRPTAYGCVVRDTNGQALASVVTRIEKAGVDFVGADDSGPGVPCAVRAGHPGGSEVTSKSTMGPLAKQVKNGRRLMMTRVPYCSRSRKIKRYGPMFKACGVGFSR